MVLVVFDVVSKVVIDAVVGGVCVLVALFAMLPLYALVLCVIFIDKSYPYAWNR